MSISHRSDNKIHGFKNCKTSANMSSAFTTQSNVVTFSKNSPVVNFSDQTRRHTVKFESKTFNKGQHRDEESHLEMLNCHYFEYKE